MQKAKANTTQDLRVKLERAKQAGDIKAAEKIQKQLNKRLWGWRPA